MYGFNMKSMDKYEAFLKEPQYFLHPYVDCAIRTRPTRSGWIVYARFHGGPEYMPLPIGRLATDAFLQQGKALTRKEYYNN